MAGEGKGDSRLKQVAASPLLSWPDLGLRKKASGRQSAAHAFLMGAMVSVMPP